MSYQGFGKSSGPSVPPKSQPAFGLNNPFPRPPSSPSIPPSSIPRSIESSSWNDGQKLLYKDLDAPTPEKPPAGTTFVASRDSTADMTARIPGHQNPGRTRSPPFPYVDDNVSRQSSHTFLRNSHSNLLIDGRSQLLPLKAQSPPLVSVSNQPVWNSQPHITVQNSHSNLLIDGRSQLLPLKAQSPSLVSVGSQPVWNSQPHITVQQPALASSTLYNQTSLSGNHANFPGHQVQPSLSPYFGSQNPKKSFTKEFNTVQVSKRSRSPPSPSTNEVLQANFDVGRTEFKRPSISPPRLRSTSNVLSTVPHSQNHQKSLPATVLEVVVDRPITSAAPKRTRSPPSSYSADEAPEENFISSEDNSEREMLAKAKRLARFKVELNKSEHNNVDVQDQKAFANKYEQSLVGQKYVGGHSVESASASIFSSDQTSSDYEGLETSNLIIGLCPDMCPESERAERERKGDLDQYERLDGDRNVTNRLLAVKKYNRTAEREESLIRPMPILQKTIDYLLNLLDQPYDERFVGTYNFLWDRMRAIRMDLRMQHIFNLGAITMLEQMIRLHIIAMHELCEYTKGEGFSEGFDAHLNIEQMNKTSVELFQMYDDHRKKGVDVPTEREFRGYYALLKLDKHPGYKVEPAELSLDLAKMTPEIRQTPEVSFARNVARACRTGNFIAFFRLARKASYLQACLMHAHFAKLRTQALASLHTGLQNNQGLPVAHAANWLAMEDEGIEDLLEYHGFLLKVFEEPYMVKEGPFLNVDDDYATKCSKLVHKKRSDRIIEDVSPSIQVVLMPVETTKEYKLEEQIVLPVQKDSSVQNVDEDMLDSEALLSPKDAKSGKALKDMQKVDQDSEADHQIATPLPSPFKSSLSNNIPEAQLTRSRPLKSTISDVIFRSSPERNLHSGVDGTQLEIVPNPAPPEISLGYSSTFPVSPPAPPSVSENESLVVQQENEDEIDEARENDQAEETAVAKLKLFLRLWKRRAEKLRMLREQRQSAANAALNSLSLGPPIRYHLDRPGNFDKFDIDTAMRERYEKEEKSWAIINVSDSAVGTLTRRNPDAKCLCWKIILCSHMNSGYKVGAAGSWLISKLMPSSDDGVFIASPGLAIWKNWASWQSGADPTCCFSVIRDTAFGRLDETVTGANAILFLISESIPWKVQRMYLHNLVMAISSGARLPLLILCGSNDEGFSSVIINELGLHDIDRSRVGSFLLVFLIENLKGHSDRFYSDQRLREGLDWLARESPLQPTLRHIKVRELVHTHLSYFLGLRGSNSKFGPNDCISVFNEALDCTMHEIIAAAKANPAGWPCPEIGLFGDFSDENKVVEMYFPTLGWSSNAKIEPIIRALQECKLPTFPDDLSWLARGSKVGHEIENHRLILENSLISYLIHTSKMMGVSLATKEARVTLQTCARLELHDSSYTVVPQWIMIFHRIFSWRLMSLSSGELCSAYISECHHDALPSSDRDVSLETSLPSSHHLNASLDEMIVVSCKSSLGMGQPRREALHHLPDRDSDGLTQDALDTSNLRDAESNLTLDKLPSIDTTCTQGFNNATSQAPLMGKATTKEAEKLSKLLEQCNFLQDVLDEKLSIYF